MQICRFGIQKKTELFLVIVRVLWLPCRVNLSPLFRSSGIRHTILVLSVAFAASLPLPLAAREERPLALAEFRRQVAEFNENIQGKLLELEINRRRLLAAEAVFAPALVMSAEHVDSNRPNTVEERRTLGGIPNFDERNNIYSAGLEWLVPSGANVGFRYMVRDLKNNLQGSQTLLFPSSSSGEIVTFIGVELTQPLLRGRGSDATLATIRLADGETSLAYQDLRREMMMILSSAELAYWNLHFAQERMRFWDESLALASRVLDDQQAALEAGRGTEIDVLLARAAVAERRARRAEAWQQRIEASNAAASFFSMGPSSGVLLVATETPRPSRLTFNLSESRAAATRANPDFLTQAVRLDMDDTRVAFAQNQSLPQLDLTASGGFNGLGNSLGASNSDIGDASYPAWSVGLRLRVPWGNQAAANQLAAERLRREKTALGINQVALQIENALDNAIAKVEATLEAGESFTAATEVKRRVLESELEGLAVGRSDSRKVIEAETDLFESMLSGVRNDLQLVRAALEVELYEGTLLERRGIEPDRDRTMRQITAILEKNRWNPDQYQKFLNDFATSLNPSSEN